MSIPEPRIYDFIFARSPEAEIEGNARLLLAFEPLIQGCVTYAVRRLPHEGRAVLMAEARFGFLLLLEKFEAEKGVPLAAYLVKQLRFYMFNYCRAEQARSQGAAGFEEVDFEPVIFAE